MPEPTEPLLVQVGRFLLAAGDGDTARALALLESHPAIARHDLLSACAAGELAAARAHLAADPGAATRDIPRVAPPLVLAVQPALKRARGVPADDHVALVRLMLDAGADPNTSVAIDDGAGRVPALYFACAENAVEVARLLLERGANPTDGESVHHAAQHDHRETLALLAEFGADLSRCPPELGAPPLYFCASHRAANPQSAAALRGMRWLLDHGADPDVPLAHPIDGMSAAQRGETALHRLAAGGHGAEPIGWLLARGATVDVRRDDGATPYTLAFRAGNRAAADALAAAGADATRLTTTDRLVAACLTSDAATARAIVAAEPGLVASLDDDAARAVHVALHDDGAEALALMLSLGWRLDVEGEWGGTPLHWAAWHGRTALVRQLLAAGAPVNPRDGRYGSSPIAWAAHGSRFAGAPSDDAHADVATLLLDAGATRAESYNRWGEAPEAFAQPGVARVLRERGFTPAG